MTNIRNACGGRASEAYHLVVRRLIDEVTHHGRKQLAYAGYACSISAIGSIPILKVLARCAGLFDPLACNGIYSIQNAKLMGCGGALEMSKDFLNDDRFRLEGELISNGAHRHAVYRTTSLRGYLNVLNAELRDGLDPAFSYTGWLQRQ